MRLPERFTPLANIVDGVLSPNKLVQVVGVVKEFMPPKPTNNTDFQCKITLVDTSTDEEAIGLSVKVFRPEAEMPNIRPRDVVIMYVVKVQNWRGEWSLITNKATDIHVYSSILIPEPPGAAHRALKATSKAVSKTPSEYEHTYVSWLYGNINKSALPDEEDLTLQPISSQSLNTRNKFSTLEHVKENNFYDVVVQAVRNPYEELDKATLWITDYTKNDSFHNFVWNGLDLSRQNGITGGDPYSYLSSKTAQGTTAATQWPGPFGQRSMQVTCFHPHDAVVMQNVQAGTWVQLRNLHVRYGRNGNNIEGFLHGDRTHPNRINVDILAADHERVKEALRRKRDYNRQRKQQAQQLTKDAEASLDNGSSLKRKAAAENNSQQQNKRMNSRQKRSAKRARLGAKGKELDLALDLNKLVKCEGLDQPVQRISSILKPIHFETSIDGRRETIVLPFNCAKFRTVARVVDFRPDLLEDFAVKRKISEFDDLSDATSGVDSSSDEDLENVTGSCVWEWRFALLLEDVGNSPDSTKRQDPPDRIWVVVGNPEAQLLTDLDASDLRDEPADLENLREQMFKLWGDLEENKLAAATMKEAKRGLCVPGERPSLVSSDNELEGKDSESRGRHVNGASISAGDATDSKAEFSNKPFACCIQQYGVKVSESDPDKADAGNGRRWERVFSLFGTRITP